MSVATLDTHKVVKTLQSVGFSEEQAEAVTQVVRDSQNLDLSNLATKTDLLAIATDLAAVKSDLAAVKSGLAAVTSDLAVVKSNIADIEIELKAEITAVKTELKAELKAEITAVKTELKAELRAEIAAAKTELKAEIKSEIAVIRTEMAEIKVEIIKWVIGIGFAQAGLVLAMLRFMR